MKTKNYLLLACLAIVPGIFACKNSTGKTDQVSSEVRTAVGIPAIDDLSQRIEASPNNAELYAARGYLWYENDNYDEGIADLEKAIQIDSTRPEYYHVLADIYMDYYKSRRALNVMERAGVAFPERIPTLLKLAEFQLILKQYNEALFSLERIRRLDPLNAEMFFMFGKVFSEMDKQEQAIAAFQSAVENDPGLIDAWIGLGNLLSDKGSPIAERYFDNALRADSNSVEALHAKAYFLSNKKNDLLGAIALYKKINTLNPQYVDGYFNAGLIYLDMDSIEQAYKSFDLAIKYEPAFPDAYYHRGYSAELTGDRQQAMADYKNTLNLDPNYKAAQAGLQRLNQ